MLYHVSEKPGLKVLRPHVSSHGRAYVYAVDDLVTGLLFGAGHDDFDLYLSNDAAGVPTVRECWPGAFQKVYQGKTLLRLRGGRGGLPAGRNLLGPGAGP